MDYGIIESGESGGSIRLASQPYDEKHPLGPPYSRMIIFYFILFIVGIGTLILSGGILVRALSRIARILKWNEFIVAFVLMAAATSLPELAIGINSALHNVSELSLGTIIGSNALKLSLAVGLVVLISGSLEVERITVVRNSLITSVYALLPLLLILDGDISRIDGTILVLSFFFYMNWLFDVKEKFTKVYNTSEGAPKETKETYLAFQIFLFILGASLLLVGSEIIIRMSRFFMDFFHISIAIMGLLILGTSAALPEIYFSARVARSEHKAMILGNLMGGVVVTSSLVLGMVTIISPIHVLDFSPYAAARLFLLVSTAVFFFFLRTRHVISRREGTILLIIYAAYLAYEIARIELPSFWN